MEVPVVDYIRIFLCLSMLGYGSWKDVETREIHDLLWLIFGGLGFLIDAYEIYTGTLNLRYFGFSIGFILVACAFLYILRLFGEADLLAFIAIIILQPTPPRHLLWMWGWIPPFFPFSIISNTALVGAFSAFIAFSRNILTGSTGVDIFANFEDLPFWKKLTLMFTGIYMKTESIRGPPFQYPMETLDVEGQIDFRPDLFDDESAEDAFKVFREQGRKHVWVSNTLPYLLVILGGYIVSIIIGDLMFWILPRLL